MRDIWLRIIICQQDVAIVKEMVILGRNVLTLNILNVVKRDMWLKIAIMKR